MRTGVQNTFLSSATGPTEKRLDEIQSNVNGDSPYQQMVDVLCEIARQLARLADAYEETRFVGYSQSREK